MKRVFVLFGVLTLLAAACGDSETPTSSSPASSVLGTFQIVGALPWRR